MSDSPKPSPTPKSIDVADLAAGLNEQQYEAFAHTHGAALVLAGAGSGKTTVLIRRIARLIAEGVPPERILVTTFTRRAADDMGERLAKLLGEEAIVGLWIGTFHSHCLRILKKEWAERFGKEGRFDLADEYWQKRVCRAILGKTSNYKSLPQPPFGQNMKLDPKLALLAISASKNCGHSCEMAETALAQLYPDWELPLIQNVAKFWRCYEKAKEKELDVLSKVPAKRLDFDDLLLEAFYLIRDDAKARDEYQSKFDFLLVDETQDTSEVQWQLARLLSKKHGNLFIVGDVGQSIYGFRGCDPKRTVMGFQTSYPNGQIIRLPANYRSQGTIVTVANELIAHADLDDRYRLLMEPTQLSAQEPWLSQHLDAEAEALWVVERLREQMSSDGTMAFRDFALLYRTNAYSRCFEDGLINAGIPYQITGGTSFYNRKEVKDLLAYLQLSVDPNSEAGTEACKRILNIASTKFGRPTRSLGLGFIKKVEELAEKQKCSFYEMLKKGVFTTQQEVAILDFRKQIKEIHEAGETAQTRLMAARLSGYDDYIVNEDGDSEDEGEGSSRLDNLDELLTASKRFFAPEGMLTFVGGQIRKAKDAGKGQDAVNLMTVHKSKGLEWRCVFVVGFAMNLLPHHRSLRYVDGELLLDSLEEERRIAYVAITRAKEQFALSWPQYHNAKALGPSPFLIEMPTLAPLVDDALRSQHKEDDAQELADQEIADEEFEE
ncbi:ATP-dependent helicase [Armatimonas sp.]|uniref:ATP-dependent helicase n=1 Tax=Armatimonas sp. TaxID=1872638 RepID=UPI00374CF2F8